MMERNAVLIKMLVGLALTSLCYRSHLTARGASLDS